MYKIIKKELLAPNIYLMDIDAPQVAKSCKPGQFIIVKIDEKGERIPLTICDYDREKGTVTIVYQTLGASTQRMAEYEAGDTYQDFVGPLGVATDIVSEDIEDLKKKKLVFIAGGVGTAPVYPQVKWMKEHGIDVDVIIGARSKDIVILEEEMKKVAKNVYVTTDDGSYGFHGNVTDGLRDLIENQGKSYDQVVAIGPLIMMKFVCLYTKEIDLPTTVSMNPIMVDGTGMCGACRLTVGDEVKFACVDGPEFDGHLIDFDEVMKRQQMYKSAEGRASLKEKEGETYRPVDCDCEDPDVIIAEVESRIDYTDHKVNMLERIPVRNQPAEERVNNFDEVCYGYDAEEAKLEASRCLLCKKPRCVAGCPVGIDIPGFIQKINEDDIAGASEVISKYSALPAVCGRVCPQESQCEAVCIRAIKGEPVSIGKLERYVGDYAIENNISPEKPAGSTGKKVAVIGAGPAGITCASELAQKGHDVTVFEALHEPGGVMVYGIPEFRLPSEGVVQAEVNNLKKLGVKIETNAVVGKVITIDQLLDEEGFDAVFIGSGAGLPMFMNIPGENANGVFSANEYLTRNNLMKAFDPTYDTPILPSKKVVTVGGGNVAMDAARTAVRLGAESHIVYRRSEAELPARVEEVEHAKEEGIIFDLLRNPKEILVDEDGWVKGIKLVKMELGEPDASGRRRPVEVEGSEYEMECDAVIMALGTNPNPLITSTTKGLETNKWECIVADEENGQTSKEGVFAGGDAVTGSATVILAMGAGKDAAKGIHEYLSNK